jgi:WD40 repeat protein
MNRRTCESIAAAVALTAMVGFSPANAALSLTAAGISDGFSLSLFVDLVPASGFCCGPLGIATNNAGQVVLQNYPNGTNSVFTNVDNQHFSNALSSAPFASTSYGAAIVNANGTLYAGNNDQGGRVFVLNPNGSSAGQLPGSAPGIAGHGITFNEATGHLVASSANGIFDINPATGGSSLIVANGGVDGVAVSANGTTIFGAAGGQIFGWNYAGTLVYSSGGIGSPDGIGIIHGNNPFSGFLVANGNDGNVYLLDPTHTAPNSIIAAGGSRGDYVGVDSTNGSLFLTQTDLVMRLTCGADCSFTANVPEPETYAMMLVGLGFLGVVARRRKKPAQAA